MSDFSLNDWSDIGSAVRTCDLVMEDELAPRRRAHGPIFRIVVGCLLAWLIAAGAHLLYPTSLLVSSIVHSSHQRHERPHRQPYRSARNR